MTNKIIQEINARQMTREVPEFGRHFVCAFLAWSTACWASGGM